MIVSTEIHIMQIAFEIAETNSKQDLIIKIAIMKHFICPIV